MGNTGTSRKPNLDWECIVISEVTLAGAESRGLFEAEMGQGGGLDKGLQAGKEPTKRSSWFWPGRQWVVVMGMEIAGES